jgi:hypothetical protein
MKTWIYIQSDKIPGSGSYGRLTHLGKVFDTKENVEKALRYQGLSFLSEVNKGGQVIISVNGITRRPSVSAQRLSVRKGV